MTSLYPVSVVSALYLLAFGVAIWRLLGGDAADLVLCLLPAVVAAFLGFTSRADRRQYVARLLAAVLFLSIGLMMWASSHAGGGLWLILVASMHVLAFLALILWLASYATRISALGGTAPTGAHRLGCRLASLHGPQTSMAVRRGSAHDEWLVDLPVGAQAGRAHRARLQIDDRRAEVRVQEFLGAAGAAPQSAHERSMRALGEAVFVPDRPDAQAVWTRTWQATMIEPDRLAATKVALGADEVTVELPDPFPADADACMTLLAAVVTRSGYEWRPLLLPFTGQPGRRASN